MRKSTSYTLRDLPEEWDAFVLKCRMEETTAAAKLREFIVSEVRDIDHEDEELKEFMRQTIQRFRDEAKAIDAMRKRIQEKAKARAGGD
jgi:hypothetical protein